MLGYQPGGSRSPREQIRWAAIQNRTNEHVPGGACMIMNGTWIVDGQAVWGVSKPEALAEELQNSSLMIFNGPNVLTPYKAGNPKSGMGKGTQDWPALALMDVAAVNPGWGSSNQWSQVGEMLGVRDDSWLLWRGREAFTFLGQARLSESESTGIQPGTSSSLKSVWVAPRPFGFVGGNFGMYHGHLTNGPMDTRVVVLADAELGSSIDNGDDFGQWTPLDHRPLAFHTNACTTTTCNYNWADGVRAGIVIPTTGFWEFSFHCSIRESSHTTQQAALGIQAWIDDEPTGYVAMRNQQLEINEYGNVVAWDLENIAMLGRFDAESGQVLNFRNISGVTADCWAVHASLHKIRL